VLKKHDEGQGHIQCLPNNLCQRQRCDVVNRKATYLSFSADRFMASPSPTAMDTDDVSAPAI
jgi:hypothetical protein